MPTRADIVREAESWVGTPFGHQQAIKGVMVDCVHYIAGVAENGGATPDIEFEDNYRRREDGQTMLRLLRDYMDYVDGPPQPADVIALHDGKAVNVPRHLVIVVAVTDMTTYICHASERGVVRHRMDASWWRRVHSVWRIRTLSE